MIPAKNRWAGIDLGPLAYESETSCLLRFAWWNALNHVSLKRHFGTTTTQFELERSVFKKQTGWSLNEGRPWDFEGTLGKPSEYWFTDGFRYCPLCLECGYHSDLFQCVAVSCCPFHEVALNERCHCCGCSTPKLSDTKRLFANPYQCAQCLDALSGVSPSSEAHLDFRAGFAAVDAALEPYFVWWRQIEPRRCDARDMQPREYKRCQDKWCSVPEFMRTLACRGTAAPKYVQASHYPTNEIVVLNWRYRISLGNIRYCEGRRTFSNRVRTGQGVYRSTLCRLERWIAREEGWTLTRFGAEVSSFHLSLATRFSTRFLAFVAFRCHLEQLLTQNDDPEFCPNGQAQLGIFSLGEMNNFDDRTSRLEWKAVFLALYASWHSRLARSSGVDLRSALEQASGHREHIFLRSQIVVRKGPTRRQGRTEKSSDEAWFEGEVSFLRIDGLPMSPWDSWTKEVCELPDGSAGIIEI
jgi:hypothetical protein